MGKDMLELKGSKVFSGAILPDELWKLADTVAALEADVSMLGEVLMAVTDEQARVASRMVMEEFGKGWQLVILEIRSSGHSDCLGVVGVDTNGHDYVTYLGLCRSILAWVLSSVLISLEDRNKAESMITQANRPGSAGRFLCLLYDAREAVKHGCWNKPPPQEGECTWENLRSFNKAP